MNTHFFCIAFSFRLSRSLKTSTSISCLWWWDRTECRMERRVRQQVTWIFCTKEELKGVLKVSVPTETLKYWCIYQVRPLKHSIFPGNRHTFCTLRRSTILTQCSTRVMMYGMTVLSGAVMDSKRIEIVPSAILTSHLVNLYILISTL